MFLKGYVTRVISKLPIHLTVEDVVTLDTSKVKYGSAPICKCVWSDVPSFLSWWIVSKNVFRVMQTATGGSPEDL